MSIPMMYTGATTAEATNKLREIFPALFGDTINDGRIVADLAARMSKWGMEGGFQQLKNLSKDGTIGLILTELNKQNIAFKNQMEPHIRLMNELIKVLNVLKINPQLIGQLVQSGVITNDQGNVLSQSPSALKHLVNHDLNMSQMAMIAEPIIREVIDSSIKIDSALTSVARGNAMVGSVPFKVLQDLGLLDNIAAGIVLPGGQPVSVPGSGTQGMFPQQGAPGVAPQYGAQPQYTQQYTAPQYGAPTPTYGAPAPQYGAPAAAPSYVVPGAPAYPSTPIVPGAGTTTTPVYDPFSNGTVGSSTGAPSTGGFDPRAILGGVGATQQYAAQPQYAQPQYTQQYAAQPQYAQPQYTQQYVAPGYSAPTATGYGPVAYAYGPQYGAAPNYGAPVQTVQFDAYGTAPVDAISLGLM